jgi:hypothetical protein
LMGYPKEGNCLVGVGIGEMIMWKWILKQYGGRVWTEFIWLRIWTSKRLLWAWWWDIRLCKMWGNILPNWETVSLSRMTLFHEVISLVLHSVATQRKLSSHLHSCWYPAFWCIWFICIILVRFGFCISLRLCILYLWQVSTDVI